MGYESKNSKFTNSSINDECKLLIDINHNLDNLNCNDTDCINEIKNEEFDLDDKDLLKEIDYLEFHRIFPDDRNSWWIRKESPTLGGILTDDNSMKYIDKEKTFFADIKSKDKENLKLNNPIVESTSINIDFSFEGFGFTGY